MHVSISAYNDGGLLPNCIQSVRDVLPNADIHVVDGRYESWPDGPDNSDDATPAHAETLADEYHADGPFRREDDKHLHRVNLAPDDEYALFLDADERLLTCPDPDALPRAAVFPRIYNAIVYGPVSVYWPRLFKPEWVVDVKRWDKYSFDISGVADDETAMRDDDVTIVHRHDLRSREYREAKLERFHNEGRKSRYEGPVDESDDRGQLEQYLSGEWQHVAFDQCPNCGQTSLTRSQLTNYGTDPLTSVDACIADDGCHRSVTEYQVDDWQYLPDDWEAGLDDDPERLRAELLDAGCEFVGTSHYQDLFRFHLAIGLWVEDHFADVDDAAVVDA
jgi:hypothetical protein